MNRKGFLGKCAAVAGAAVAMLVPPVGQLKAAREKVLPCQFTYTTWHPFYSCVWEYTMCNIGYPQKRSIYQAYEDWDSRIPLLLCSYGWRFTGGCC